MHAIAGDEDICRGLDIEPGQEHDEDAGDVVEGLVAHRLHVGGILELDAVDVAEGHAAENDDVMRLTDVDAGVTVTAGAAALDHTVGGEHREEAELAVIDYP